MNREGAELEYLNGNYQQSESFIERALGLARSAIEKAEIYDLQVVQHNMLGRHEEAIRTGAMALSLLNVQVPEKDLKAALHEELAKAREALGGREIGTASTSRTIC